MKKKGFTLVELLVVIAIIALLMGILMPALAKVRQLAHRMVCGTNLSGIGKAMLVYATDNEDEYPRAGGRASKWPSNGYIAVWDDTTLVTAFGGSPTTATITSSFFLLVKYAEVQTKQFVCKGDAGARVFKLSDGVSQSTDVLEDVTEVWDFGKKTGIYCSYSYHLPYNNTAGATGFPLSSISNSASPIAADRNPYLDRNAADYIDGTADGEDAPSWTDGEYYDQDKTGNSAAHQREGQNVLFNDTHVAFARYPNCGIANDNIWKIQTAKGAALTEQLKQLGLTGITAAGNPQFTASGSGGTITVTGGAGDAVDLPASAKDAFLVNEHIDGGIPYP